MNICFPPILYVHSYYEMWNQGEETVAKKHSDSGTLMLCFQREKEGQGGMEKGMEEEEHRF